MTKIVAVLETMWDWRQMTSGAGYREAPRSFRINPQNHSGKRLYRIIGQDADLHVTNACRELCASANHHGTPDAAWLKENLEILMPFDILLVCGKIAQKTYRDTGFVFENMIEMPHPAARMWTLAMIESTAEKVRALVAAS